MSNFYKTMAITVFVGGFVLALIGKAKGVPADVRLDRLTIHLLMAIFLAILSTNHRSIKK